MSIGSVTSNSSGYAAFIEDNSARAVKEKDPLGRDAFLTMLVAQLKNQDPLNPMQGSEFSAQLAQFSSLEQLFNVNSNLESLQGSFDQGNEKNYLDYIGKQVSVKDSTFALADGKSIGGAYELNEASSVVINIYDADGLQVAQLTPGSQEAGIHDVGWSGKGEAGELFPNGQYTYEVYSLGDNGSFAPVDTGFNGKITGVTFENGSAYLLMGDRLVAPSAVTKVWEDA